MKFAFQVGAPFSKHADRQCARALQRLGANTHASKIWLLKFRWCPKLCQLHWLHVRCKEMRFPLWPRYLAARQQGSWDRDACDAKFFQKADGRPQALEASTGSYSPCSQGRFLRPLVVAWIGATTALTARDSFFRTVRSRPLTSDGIFMVTVFARCAKITAFHIAATLTVAECSQSRIIKESCSARCL